MHPAEPTIVGTARAAGEPYDEADADADTDTDTDTATIKEMLPQPAGRCSCSSVPDYQYVRLEEVPSKMFGIEGGFSQGQLVWVCKSKGRRRNGGAGFGPSPRNVSDPDDGHPQQRHIGDPCDVIDQQHPSKNGFTWYRPSNRLELFMRGRVVSQDSNRPSACVGWGGGGESSTPRVLVRYPEGSTYRVRVDHLIPILDGGPAGARNLGLVIAVSETPEYRKCCAVHSLPHETLVEIGSDLGHNLERVYRTGGGGSNPNRRRLVGVDKSPTSIAAASASYPHLSFVRWDPLEEPVRVLYDGLNLLTDGGGDEEEKLFRPDVVAIDINGTRELPAVLRCLSVVFEAGWEPRLIVVKSRALHAYLGAEKEENGRPSPPRPRPRPRLRLSSSGTPIVHRGSRR
jgi:hypothetical protein